MGDIDELRIYDTALSPGEIAALAESANQAGGAWLYRHFGNTAPGWESDTDADQAMLLCEYALGGNPHRADGEFMTPAATYNAASGQLEISYTQRVAGSHDLTYNVRVSDDLIHWELPYTEISSVVHPQLDSDFQQVFVEIDSTAPDTNRRFVRIEITAP